MSLDLGSPAIEIAIGLSFVFFLLSLIVTAVTEWFAGVVNLRAKYLKKGLEGMLGDETLAKKLVCHPLARTDLGERERDPSYLSPRNFARAFRDSVEVVGDRVQAKGLPPRKEKQGGDQLNTQLEALTDSGDGGNLPPVPVLEEWFDDSMRRVSGWYKRKAQIVALVVALVVTLVLNASALRIAEHLAEEPTVRAAVVAKAEGASEPKGAGDLKQAGQDMEDAIDELGGLKLPIFWAEEYVPDLNLDSVARAVAGWAITWFAISLGAPFWFDALSKLSNLRMAGRRPEDKPSGPTAP
jgi:hypothetical protein